MATGTDALSEVGPGGEGMDDLEAWFRDELHLEVQTTYLSEVGKMFTARVGQAMVQRPNGLVLLAPTSFDVAGRAGTYAERLAEVVAWAPRLVVLACVRRDDAWQPEYVIGIGGSESFDSVRAAFPNAQARAVQPLPGLTVSSVAPAAPSVPPPIDTAALADELLVDEPWLKDLLAPMLERDRDGLPRPRAVMLYGPPGTGKTYVARRIARYLAPSETSRAFVQLHPSFGYEDFFEGYRPAGTGGGGLALEKRSGPLRRLAEHARANPDSLTVLVMDEVNRGNLPRVFGELYFLLEYRDQAVSLMYSPDDRFTLPRNLLLIGTMNTADRSVVVLDQALRRRFDFVSMFADKPPIRHVLRRYLARQYADGRFAWVADVVEAANAHLDRNQQIGPSYFMRDDLDDATIARVWRTSVIPSIEEQFFGREHELAELDLDALKAALPT
jgi:hypothetical protein